ncbi:MAG: HEAT repeat domain-containing protein [Desulfuromonadales bacterium]
MKIESSPLGENSQLPKRQQHMEEALQRLARLLKTIRYYPPRHPALAAAAESAKHGFEPLFAAGEDRLLLAVRKDFFLLDEQPFGQGNLLLKKLANHLFARRVQTLLFLPDLTGADLRSFGRCLALDVQTIHGQGGVPGVLSEAKVSTLWVNETDLSLIYKRKEEIEAQKLASAGDESRIEEELDQLLKNNRQEGEKEEERSLEVLLQELREVAGDAQCRAILQEIAPLFRLAQAEQDRYLVLEALTQLHRDSVASGHSPLRRGLSSQLLEQLISEDVLGGLTDFLCTRGIAEETREQIFSLLILFPEKVVSRLMDRLARENDLPARRLIIEALTRQGPAAAPMLTGYLADSRWFVVRNAVAVLGEIREPQSASLLLPLLSHKDVRVARETVRALTKIGGARALGVLLSLIEGEDSTLARQALLSLGAMKTASAVPVIVKLINRSDPMGKRTEIKKEAIKALGEIGAAEAVPSLIAILRRQRFWRRADFNELRAAAATALGEIRDASAQPALEEASEARSDIVARAANQSLKQLKKLDEHGSGTN